MQCMICKQEVGQNEIMCPYCGALPWKIPESFLNSEQHLSWLEEVYKPQLLRWEKSKQLNDSLVELQGSISSIKEEIQLLQDVQAQSSNNANQNQPLVSISPEYSVDDKGVLRSVHLDRLTLQFANGITAIGDATSIVDRYHDIRIGGHYFTELVSTIIIPDSVLNIGPNAFRGFSKLRTVVIPDSVETIGDNAFENCVSLESIVIPNGIKRIGVKAFYECRALNSVKISSSVESIGIDAFGFDFETYYDDDYPPRRNAILPLKLQYIEYGIGTVFPKECWDIEWVAD